MNQQEPDRLVVLERLDQLARLCGFIDRYHMKTAVLKSRGLTPLTLKSYNQQRWQDATSALKAKYR